VPRQQPAGAADHRDVDHLAINGEGAAAFGCGLFVGAISLLA
jgi:hypothetical protein